MKTQDILPVYSAETDPRGELRNHIRETMQEFLDEYNDVARLAKLLAQTVGEEIALESGSLNVEAEDIEQALQEWKASKELCTSGKPNSALGASALASCKSQGYRSREGDKSHKIGSKRVSVKGKKMKGKQYGGDLPDYS